MDKKGRNMHTHCAKKSLLLMINFPLIINLAIVAMLIVGPTPLNINVAKAAACDNASPVALNQTLKQNLTSQTTQGEWVTFQVQKDGHYVLQVNNAQGLNLAVYDRCDVSASSVALDNGNLEFTANRDGEYFLYVKNSRSMMAASGSYQVAFSPAKELPSIVAADVVPPEVLRRATEFMENLRGSQLTPEWANARINPAVRIMYRPDIQGPAYYEVSVEKPGAQGYEPAGFIQLAAGEHDYPIVNWSATGKSTTQELANLAPLGATITNVYRLNAMSYAAEYTQLSSIDLSVLAANVLTLGSLPNQILGLSATPPSTQTQLINQTADSDGKVTYDGPATLPLLEEKPFDSWAALKSEYGTAFAPLNAALKQRATSDWDLQKNFQQYGETLVQGYVRQVIGLATQTISTITVTGDGADPKYLKQEMMSVGTTPTGITLTVLAEPPAGQKILLPINVNLTYASGVTETVKFAIANHVDMNFSIRIFMPVAFSGVSTKTIEKSEAEFPTVNSWGPWHYYPVDNMNDALAIRYNQIAPQTYNNPYACYSGCAATGWAMLFAWVDRHWAGHWGLYRVNGGLGANAIAPTTMDAGVRNVLMELRGYLHTTCDGNQGGTQLPDEINAYKYVQPRASSYWVMRTRYDPTRLCWFNWCDGARNLIVDSIVNRHTPAVLGADHHIQLAVEYAWQSQESCFLWWCHTDYNRWFYVNKGWGGAGNAWVDYDDVYFGGTYSWY